MKLREFITVFCLGLATIAASPAYAQQPDAQGRPSGLTIRLNTDLVVIDVTATDKSGAYVRNLRPEEIQLFEDGQERKINFFAMNDEVALSRPLAVVFALDLSGSLRTDEMTTLRQAAMKFTDLMKGDSVFAAMSFNYKVKIVQDFTPDPGKIERAFANMNKFEGSTRIYDALDRAPNAQRAAGSARRRRHHGRLRFGEYYRPAGSDSKGQLWLTTPKTATGNAMNSESRPHVLIYRSAQVGQATPRQRNDVHSSARREG